MEDQCIDVMCINCGEMVPADQVTAHSLRCQQVHPFVASMENSEILRLLDFKIEKLRLAMQLSATGGAARADRISLSTLSEIAGKLLKNYGVSEASLQFAKEALEALSAFLLDFHGSTSVSLYGERLKALAKDKEAELQRALGENALSKQLSEKDEEISRLKREVEQLRSNTVPSAVLAQRADAVLEEVRSEAAPLSRQSSQTSVTSPVPEPAVPKKSAAEVAVMSQDDRKRYFFTQSLAIKLTFGPKSKAQYVKIPQLYEKAVTQGVAVENWPDFIRNELASA